MPGPITSRMSEGVNKLIKEGVHPATEAADILEILEVERKQRQLDVKESPLKGKPKDKIQAKILKVLDGQTKHIDIISRETGLSIDKVSSALSMMELNGFVKNYGSGVWGS